MGRPSKGGRVMDSHGYVLVTMSEHPRALNGRYVREHLLVVERALGRPVPLGKPVHHVNGDRTDNRGANLVLCENYGYHRLLHIRERALKACGHADWRPCEVCREYGDPGDPDFRLDPRGKHHYHRSCMAERAKTMKRGA